MKNIIYIMILSSFLHADIMDNIKSGISSGITYTKEKSETAPAKAEMISIEMDLERAYKIIGRKYVEHANSHEHKDIGLDNLIKELQPLMKRKKVLEQEVAEIESKYHSTDNLNREIEKLESSK